MFVGEEDRYESMTSHDPNYKFMVWDYYENLAVAFNARQEDADLVTEALNCKNCITWDVLKQRWIDESEPR